MAAPLLTTLAERATLIQAVFAARRPPETGQKGAQAQPPFRHDDWHALVRRFTVDDRVDYPQLCRVRRLLEAYLDRLSHARPEEWPDAGERLAFYLNSYNAIAVHQALIHYPVASLCDVPAAFARPYPIGRELHTLHTLLHLKLRGSGDPLVHAGVVPAAASAPRLRVYSGATLHADLQAQVRELLADVAHGLRVDGATSTLLLNQTFRWFAGDFAHPARMPSVVALVQGLARPRSVLQYLKPYLPDEARSIAQRPDMRLSWLPYDWSLNSSTVTSDVRDQK